MPDSSAPPIDPAVAIIVGSVRRALGQPAPAPDPQQVSPIAPRIAALAMAHRLGGCLTADPAIGPYLNQQSTNGSRDRTITLLLELSGLLERLSQAGVTAIPLKGPLLAARLIGNPTFREAHDIDILVRWEQIDQAEAALAPEYQPDSPRRRNARIENHQLMKPMAGGRAVELHWQLLHPRTGATIPETDIWANPTRYTTAGIRHMALDPAVEIAVTCTHAAHHFGVRLHWMCDVALLALKSDQDTWNRAIQIGKRWGVRRAMLTAVDSARILFDLPLGSTLSRRVEQYSCRPVAKWMAQRVLSGADGAPSQFSLWRRRPRLYDHHLQMARTTAILLFTPLPDDRNAAGLPAWAGPLAGLLRPVFVLQRAIKREIHPGRTARSPDIGGDQPGR